MFPRETPREPGAKCFASYLKILKTINGFTRAVIEGDKCKAWPAHNVLKKQTFFFFQEIITLRIKIYLSNVT